MGQPNAKAGLIGVLLLLSVAMLSIYGIDRTSAQPTIAIDGSSIFAGGGSSSNVLIPVKAGDLVVVQVDVSPESNDNTYGGCCPGHYQTAFLESVASNATGPFQQRFAFTRTVSSGDGSMLWEWYSVSTSTGTASITSTLNHTAAWGVIAYSVTGANDSYPFDTNPALPATSFNDCNTTDGCRVSFSTTAPATLVIAGIAAEGCPTMTAPSNGFTLVKESDCNSWVSGGVAYRTFTSPQTSTSTGNWGLSTGESAFWYADAIVAGASPSSSTTLSTSSSSISSTQSSSSSTTMSSSSSSTQTTYTTETATCTVTYTLNGQLLVGWQGSC